MSYMLIDSPLTPYSTKKEVNKWLDYLDTLPDSKQKTKAIEEAKTITEVTDPVKAKK
jgi:hypothetical protein